MGIKTLLPFLRKRCPEAFSSLADGGRSFLSNKSVAVDVSNQVHKILYLVNTTDVSTFERACRDQIRWFLGCRSRPVFVFDGKTPQAKKQTCAKRRSVKQEYRDKARRATERSMHTKAAQYERLALCPDGRHYEAFRRACTSLGCSHLTADGEAERHCVEMENCGSVDAIVSDDTDVLALGCRHMLLRVSSSHCQLVDGQVVRDALEMTTPTFRDFCILCGTDVNDRMSRVGPVTAFKLLQSQGSLEGVLSHLREKGQQDVDDFEGCLPVARAFLTTRA